MKQVKAPIFEIHGTGIHNRGAELMAIAISEKIWSIYPQAIIAVPSTFGLQKDIKRYGFKTTAALEIQRKRPIFSLITAFITGNLVSQKDIDIVLDASGFAFSDQWGVEHAKRLSNKMSLAVRGEQDLILLPQALGPFENEEVKNYSKQLFERAKMVFARDNKSFEHVSKMQLSTKLKKSPDFTVAIIPKVKKEISLPDNFVSIVPNARMLDKSDNAESYLAFLKKTIDIIIDSKLKPVFVVHDGYEDKTVVTKLGDKYKNITIIEDQDPRVLKWVLGKSEFVVGSRFHALVSALSQGVPCIGAGWSHKYPELFNDFNNSEGLVEDMADFDNIEHLISSYCNIHYRSERAEKIKIASNKIKIEVEEMWEDVMREIKFKFNQSN